MELIKKEEIVKILNKFDIDISIDEIEKRYAETHRYYHTIEHVNFMINEIYELYKKSKITENNKNILIVSAIFHDIIYNVSDDVNEIKSAELLKNKTKYVDEYQDNYIQKIYNIIIDTKTHITNDELSQIFCDLDMYTISDSSFGELLKYEKQIYLEYQKFGFNEYRIGRIKFLKSMLNNKYGEKNYDNILKLIEYIENHTPKIGVYDGSFNPLHIGHNNIIEKSQSLFDKIIIAVGINPEKNGNTDYIKTLKENSEKINNKLNKEVCFYNGLVTDFIKEKQLAENIEITLIRGLRDGFDIVYENRQIQYMRDMYPELKIVYIPGDREFDYISSSGLRHLKTYDEKLIEKYLP